MKNSRKKNKNSHTLEEQVHFPSESQALLIRGNHFFANSGILFLGYEAMNGIDYVFGHSPDTLEKALQKFAEYTAVAAGVYALGLYGVAAIEDYRSRSNGKDLLKKAISEGLYDMNDKKDFS